MKFIFSSESIFRQRPFFPFEIIQTTVKSLYTITVPCTKRNKSLQEKGRVMTQSWWCWILQAKPLNKAGGQIIRKWLSKILIRHKWNILKPILDKRFYRTSLLFGNIWGLKNLTSTCRQGQKERHRTFSSFCSLYRLGNCSIKEKVIAYQYFWRDLDDGPIWPSGSRTMALVCIINKVRNLPQTPTTALLTWDSETTTASIFNVFLFHGQISTFYSNIIVTLRIYRIISDENKHLFLVTNFSVLHSIHAQSLYKCKSCDCFHCGMLAVQWRWNYF